MRKILVVGLDLGTRASLAAVLDACVLVDTVATPSAGLRYLTTSPPEIVILDICPPDFDAMCFLHTVRSQFPACRVVAVTPASDPYIFQEVTALRIDGLFRRPFHVHELLDRVTSLLTLAGTKVSLPRLGPHLTKAIEYVSDHYGSPLTVETIASTINLSASHLAHAFRAQTGATLKEYVTKVRVEVTKHFLRETDEKLDAIAELTGFCDASHLSRIFRHATGLRPGQYRRRASLGAAATDVASFRPAAGDNLSRPTRRGPPSGRQLRTPCDERGARLLT